MALELVSSGYRRSFCPPALEVECSWRYANGKVFHTLTLAEPHELASMDWWWKLQWKIGRRAFEIKQEEVLCLPT